MFSYMPYMVQKKTFHLLVYITIITLLSLFYFYIMNRYRTGWQSLPVWEIPTTFQAKTIVSVLVPARNESENILNCIHSILNQDYPNSLFEIIVINDHSTDNTAELIAQLNHPQVKLLNLAELLKEDDETQSFKKKAIEIAIAHATGELIVTTDADCIVPKDWLRFFVSYHQKYGSKFIAAPVNFYQEKSLIEKFQSLDFVGMMGITGAGIDQQLMNMCNGANLAYEKKVFNEVNGFEGIDHVASGDDMMLMQKVAEKYPNKIGFIKNKKATVLTLAKPSWTAFLNQRIRWASKSTSYQEWKVTFILAMVFFFCVSIVVNLLLIPFFGNILLIIFVIQLLIKAIADYLLLKEMSNFFDRKDLMKIFWPALFLHLTYIVVVGFLGNLKKDYDWKGRKVS